MIDLRSDTFTLPSEEMREHIASAEVGDDYYGEDKSVNRLEDYCKELFGKEAAIFTTTGMLANQLAIITQVSRGNEVILDYNSHMNLFESAQYAAFCQVVLNGRKTKDGVLRVSDVIEAVRSKPRESPYARVELVAIENTINSQAGRVFPFDEIQELRAYTRKHSFRLHLDGARLFNAHAATGILLSDYAQEVDTLTVCFSKGLGAPFGSMLLGPKAVIERARRFRVWYGSGFHQVGFCAEAAYFALTRQFSRLYEDNRLTKSLAEKLARQTDLDVDPSRVDTNMIFIDLAARGIDAASFLRRCEDQGLLALTFLPGVVRLVVSRNVAETDIDRAAEILIEAASQCLKARPRPGLSAVNSAVD